MDLSISSVTGTTSSLLTQAVGMSRAVTAVQATQATTRSPQQSAVRLFQDDEEDTGSWSDGLGSRFAPETANTLLDAQETATSAQADQTFYFDPLDTNKDGKVTYYEWLAGQKSNSSASTAAGSTATASSGGQTAATSTSLAA